MRTTILLLLAIVVLWIELGRILDNYQIIEQHHLWALYGYVWGIIVGFVIMVRRT